MPQSYVMDLRKQKLFLPYRLQQGFYTLSLIYESRNYSCLIGLAEIYDGLMKSTKVEIILALQALWVVKAVAESTKVEIILALQACTNTATRPLIYESRNYSCLIGTKSHHRQCEYLRKQKLFLPYRLQTYQSSTTHLRKQKLFLPYRPSWKDRMFHLIYESRNYSCLIGKKRRTKHDTHLRKQKLFLPYRPAHMKRTQRANLRKQKLFLPYRPYSSAKINIKIKKTITYHNYFFFLGGHNIPPYNVDPI